LVSLRIVKLNIGWSINSGDSSAYLPYSQLVGLHRRGDRSTVWRERDTSSPVAQFLHRTAAAVAHRQELVRSWQRLVGTSFPTVGKNITATMHIASSALLPPNEYLAQALHQLRGTLKQKKTLAFVVAGLIGLAFFCSILAINARRELAKQTANAATNAAASTSPQQIEFSERFAIEPRSPISLEAANRSGTAGATPFSEGAQTFGQVSREPVPLPRPRRHR